MAYFHHQRSSSSFFFLQIKQTRSNVLISRLSDILSSLFVRCLSGSLLKGFYQFASLQWLLADVLTW